MGKTPTRKDDACPRHGHFRMFSLESRTSGVSSLLLLLLLLSYHNPGHAFTSSRRRLHPSNTSSSSSRIRKNYFHVRNKDSHIQLLPEFFSSMHLADTTGQMIPSHGNHHHVLSQSWDALHHAWQQHTTMTTSSSSSSSSSALSSSSLTTAKAAVSIPNPPSWASTFPTLPTNLQDLEVEMEEKAINSLGRDVLVFLAASVVVVPLSRTLGVSFGCLRRHTTVLIVKDVCANNFSRGAIFYLSLT